MAIKGKKISEIRGSKTKKQEYHLVQLTNDEIGIVLQLVKNSNFNTIHELNFIKAAINASQITGKDARFVVTVLDKVDKQITKESKKLTA